MQELGIQEEKEDWGGKWIPRGNLPTYKLRREIVWCCSAYGWKSKNKKELVWCCGSYGWKSMKKKENNMVMLFLWFEIHEQERKEYGVAIPMEQCWVCK